MASKRTKLKTKKPRKQTLLVPADRGQLDDGLATARKVLVDRQTDLKARIDNAMHPAIRIGQLTLASEAFRNGPEMLDKLKEIQQFKIPNIGCYAHVLEDYSKASKQISLAMKDAFSDITTNAVQLDPPSVTSNARPDRDISSVEALGKIVRAYRKQKKLSQQSFADIAGVGRRFLSELESGKSTLQFDKVLKVMAAAGINLIARER